MSIVIDRACNSSRGSDVLGQGGSDISRFHSEEFSGVGGGGETPLDQAIHLIGGLLKGPLTDTFIQSIQIGEWEKRDQNCDKSAEGFWCHVNTTGAFFITV
ncbi:MAG: hypothetical protein DRI93_00020 [Aquificota bacterium]|nr:MAG: hypothetical protein DRI93_00020 [Aquificota bacterium]